MWDFDESGIYKTTVTVSAEGYKSKVSAPVTVEVNKAASPGLYYHLIGDNEYRVELYNIPHATGTEIIVYGLYLVIG